MTFEILADQIQDKLNQAILAELEAEGSQVLALILCGSRATGDERSDSDVDAVAVLSPPFPAHHFGEYYGTLPHENPLLLQLTLLGTNSFEAFFKAAAPERIHALCSAKLITGNPAIFEQIRFFAREVESMNLRSMVDELENTDPESFLSAARFTLSSGRGAIRNSPRSGDALARLARFSEFALEVYILGEMWRLGEKLRKRKHGIEDELIRLYHLRGQRGARFLNSARYPLSPWFEAPAFAISRLFATHGKADFDQFLTQSLEQLESAFEKLTGGSSQFTQSDEQFIFCENAHLDFQGAAK